jgi:hypothetical protein
VLKPDFAECRGQAKHKIERRIHKVEKLKLSQMQNFTRNRKHLSARQTSFAKHLHPR